MTTTSYPWAATPVHSGVTSLLASLTDAAFVWRQRMREARRARAGCRDLSAISASTLRDIGIHRSEIISLSLGDSSRRRR